jgi:hypothetical protein
MGYGISHQKAGLNWAGKYKQVPRETRIQNAKFRMQNEPHPSPGAPGGAPPSPSRGEGNPHPKWWRITGITPAVEKTLAAKKRREGLKRLVRWIENEMQNAEFRMQNGTQVSGQSSVVCGPLSVGSRADKLSLVTEWEVDVEEWEGARRAGRSVESLCVELGITRAKLTMLTKEYCGLTAQELVDGFKVRGLRKHLVVRFREAAERMWGWPGNFAAWKWEGFRKPSLKLGAETGGGRIQNSECRMQNERRSRYFRKIGRAHV